MGFLNAKWSTLKRCLQIRPVKGALARGKAAVQEDFVTIFVFHQLRMMKALLSYTWARLTDCVADYLAN